jgi:hypothetical protein
MATHRQQATEDSMALRLRQLAKKTFGLLYPTESKLLDKAPRSGGEWALGSSDPDHDDAVKEGVEWNRDREVRSELLRWLCVNESARKLIDPHGLAVWGAKITGPLDLSFVAVPFPLKLNQCYFEKQPDLSESELPSLDLSRSRVPGINASNSRIKGSVLLKEGFRSDGEVNLRVAHIEGNFECDGASLSNPPRNNPETGKLETGSGTALVAEGATFGGFVLMRQSQESGRKFQSEGEVSLLGAQITGDLDCEAGQFSNLPTDVFPETDTLNADRIFVKGSVFLRYGFVTKGAVRMRDAQIGGTLDCDGGTFYNPLQQGTNIGGDALTLDRAVIKGALLFRTDDDKKNPQFSAAGEISLIAAVIGGPLDLLDGNLREATLNLSGATAASIQNTGETLWPKQNHLYVRLFQYRHIIPRGATECLRWLKLQPDDDFNTESYVQLANVLQQSGDDDGARLVMQTAAALEAKHGHRYWYLRPDNWFAASIGYGYRPIWAVGYISIMSALGWVIYRRAFLAGTIVPTDKDAYEKVKSEKCLPRYYARFTPLILSLENSLPLVKLGQADKWQPDPESSPQMPHATNPELAVALSLVDSPLSTATLFSTSIQSGGDKTNVDTVEKLPEPSLGAAPLAHQESYDSLPRMFAAIRGSVRGMLCSVGLQPDANGQTPPTPLSRHGTSPQFLRGFIWVQILLGWLFATLFVAGVTGIIRKQ